MKPPEPCPSCGAAHVQVPVTRPTGYGRYRRLECCVCGHRWTHREAIGRSLPPARHQCPECGSDRTSVIESRVTPYGRRQRIDCRNCQHRWTNAIEGPAKTRNQRQRRSGALREAEVLLILTSQRSDRQLARELGVSREAVRGVRRGELHAQTLPELPRAGSQGQRRSCVSCRFWDAESVRPCREGWPDPETDGPGYANECEDYYPIKV